MAISHGFAGIPVSDFPTAYDWYVRLFGREADMFPIDGEAVWRLTSNGSAYIVCDPERAGNALLTLAIDDLDTHAKRLRSEGFALAEQAGGDAPRRLTTTDQDGNRITFFQDPGHQVD